jgi:3-deoxy-D-manno-octulosonic acid (KDO) 8-phosphate synthase
MAVGIAGLFIEAHPDPAREMRRSVRAAAG